METFSAASRHALRNYIPGAFWIPIIDRYHLTVHRVEATLVRMGFSVRARHTTRKFSSISLVQVRQRTGQAAHQALYHAPRYLSRKFRNGPPNLLPGPAKHRAGWPIQNDVKLIDPVGACSMGIGRKTGRCSSDWSMCCFTARCAK